MHILSHTYANYSNMFWQSYLQIPDECTEDYVPTSYGEQLRTGHPYVAALYVVCTDVDIRKRSNRYSAIYISCK